MLDISAYILHLLRRFPARAVMLNNQLIVPLILYSEKLVELRQMKLLYSC